MKRLCQLLLVILASLLVLAILMHKSKPAYKSKGNVADWLPQDTQLTDPTIEPSRGFEIIHAETIHGKTIIQTFQAKAIRAVDGDTIELLLEDKTHPNFRLEGIDCPEKKQAFGSKATEALKALAVGKLVTVHDVGNGGFNRRLVVIEADGINVNAELIRQGLAWHFKKYSDDVELAQLESEARDAKRGLWADANPVEPWNWRKAQKSVSIFDPVPFEFLRNRIIFDPNNPEESKWEWTKEEFFCTRRLRTLRPLTGSRYCKQEARRRTNRR